MFFVCAPFAHAQSGQRIAVPVFEFPAMQGSWNKMTNAVSSGRIYDFAVSMDDQDTTYFVKQTRVVFANPGDFDLFECWVSLAPQPHAGRTRFLIEGDGVSLYRSQWMTWRDKAKKVSVPVKGYKGISLIVEGYQMNQYDMAIWGEPVLVQTNPPQLTETPSRFPTLMTVRQSGKGAIGLSIDGMDIAFGNARPINENGHLLVPMRSVFEALGARLRYNPGSRQIVATRGDQTISLAVGTQTALINGYQTDLDVPSRSVAGETMVPLRFVAEALGVAVEYKR